MRLPLMRNQLPTTSTPHHLRIPPHAFAAYAEPTPNNQYTAVSIAIELVSTFNEGIFFRSAHVLARREPQCPTRASVPDEGLSARREQVRASPTRSPHGPPHDSPHAEADLRNAFAADAEPTPDNQYRQLRTTSQFLHTEGTNPIFWRFDCDGGDEC